LTVAFFHVRFFSQRPLPAAGGRVSKAIWNGDFGFDVFLCFGVWGVVFCGGSLSVDVFAVVLWCW